MFQVWLDGTLGTQLLCIFGHGVSSSFAVVSCTRRGRIGHQIQDCFARSTKDGQSLLDKKTQTYGGEISGINKNHQVSRKRKRPFAGKKRIGVDVLEYQHGNIYVSKSNNIDACIHQHAMRSVI